MSIPATCPFCGQVGHVPEKAIGHKAKCPSCGKGFEVADPGIVEMIPPQESSPYNPPPVRQAPLEQEPAADQGPLEFAPMGHDTYEPPKRRSPWVIYAVIGGVPLVIILAVIVIAISRRSPFNLYNARCPLCGREFLIPEEHRGNFAQISREYHCPNCGIAQPAVSLYEQYDKSHGRKNQHASAGNSDVAGAGMVVGWLLCYGIFFVGFITSWLLMMAFVARDARNRGVDGGATWVIAIFFTWMLGFLVYLASRPYGMLVPCSRCGNKKLQMARACPHCGEPAPA